jgi:hypothetical protein
MATNDPAIDLFLRGQPDRYGGIARWAHQFMLAEEAVARLEAAGFQCPAPAHHATRRLCVKRDDGLAAKLEDIDRGERVIISLKHPGPRIGAIEGMWAEATPNGPSYSARLSAPGLSFRDARTFADYVLDLQPDWWQPRKYCYPAAIPRGCDAERAERAERGWRHWDGKSAVTAGTAAESWQSLRESGFACSRFDAGERNATRGLRREGDRAWIDCTAEALDGQPQKVSLGLDAASGRLEVLRVAAGTDALEIPVAR